MYIKTTLIIALLFFAGFGITQGQISREEYGKNRVQYKNFDWRFYSSDNFDIYFYEGGQNNAMIAAKYLEKEFERVTDVVGYAPYSKTKIFLYNSIQDLQQSNVGVHEKIFSANGQTNFVKSQVEIAYPGSMAEFKNELVLQISRMLINDMMFGGSLTDMFQSAYLLSLPDWFIEGAARYIAHGWDIEMDDMMRDLFQNHKNVRLSRLNGEEAAIAGQSVWNFIAARYGRSSISNILNLTRIIRNEESSIVNTLGIPSKLFMRQWQDFYREMLAQIAASYVYPEKANRIRKNNRKNLVYNDVAISPNGQYIAYSENDRGRYVVKVRNVKTKRTKTLYKGGYRAINQPVDENIPLLSWNNDQLLGIIGNKQGQSYLWIHNVNSKGKREILLRRVNQVKDFAFSPNGRMVILSADINGQNDLFTLNPNRNTLTRLTDDIYDDLHPRYIPGSNQIVFSSNRPDDSLYYASERPKGVNLEQEITENYNIFILNPDTQDSLLTRVTNTISKDIRPVPKDENTIFYLSDQQGIYNLYQYNLADSIFNQVSNYSLSIKDYDINFQNHLFSYVMLSEEDDYLYIENDYNLSKSIFTPQTQRQQAIQARMVSERIAQNSKKNKILQNDLQEVDSIPSVTDSLAIGVVQDSIPENTLPADSLPTTVQDSLSLTPQDSTLAEQQGEINTEDYQFEGQTQEPLQEGMIDTENYAFNNPQEDNVATDDYQFDNNNLSENNNASNSFLARYRKLQRETRIEGPFPYQNRFSADNVVTSLVVDPLRNFGFHIEVQMNDMLENHHFYGGVVQYTDLRSAGVFAEYQYLKNRVDFSLRYQREGLYRNTNDAVIHKYTLNRFQAGAALPLNVSTRLELNPFIVNTHYIDLGVGTFDTIPSPQTENTRIYGGLRAGFVFDNTVNNGNNRYEGTRASAFFTHHQGIDDPSGSFSNIRVDIRHYQKIHRELTLATRVFYGNFFGSSPKSYLLGGMNNWLFFNTDNPRDNPLTTENKVENSDLLFVEFVDMRGFNYNKFNGTDVLTFTAELRFPVVRYFYQGPITSNFFRNLELIGFYDIGSSWTGASPFSETNSLNTEVIDPGPGTPFRAEINNFKNPWLQSYGAGIRTALLGYYIKLDMAYPIEDNVVGERPRFYVTLGYDF